MTTAWWDFRRTREQSVATVHLVTGGHPDQWLRMLANWRITPTEAQFPSSRPRPQTGSTRIRNRDGDHRWVDPVISAVTRDLIPTVRYSTPPEDGPVRGMFCADWEIDDDTDWRYTVVAYPASVVITHMPTGEVRHDYTKRAPAWGVLKAHAEAVGDDVAVARIAAEEMVDGLSNE